MLFCDIPGGNIIGYRDADSSFVILLVVLIILQHYQKANPISY